MKNLKKKRLVALIVGSGILTSSALTIAQTEKSNQLIKNSSLLRNGVTAKTANEPDAPAEAVEPTIKDTTFRFDQLSTDVAPSIADSILTTTYFKNLIYTKKEVIWENSNLITADQLTIGDNIQTDNYEGTAVIQVNIHMESGKDLPFTITITGFKKAFTSILMTELAYGDKSVHVADVNDTVVRQILKTNQDKIFKNLPKDYNFDSIVCSNYDRTVQEQISLDISLPNTKINDAGDPLVKRITITGYAPDDIKLKLVITEYATLFSGPAPKLFDSVITKEYFKSAIVEHASIIFDHIPKEGLKTENIIIDKDLELQYATGKAIVKFTVNNAPNNTEEFALTINGFATAIPRVKANEFKYGSIDQLNLSVDASWVKEQLISHKDDVFEDIPPNFVWSTLQVDTNLDTSVVGKVIATVTLPNVKTAEDVDFVTQITIGGFRTDGLTTEIHPGKLDGLTELVASKVTNDNEQLIRAIMETTGIITATNPDAGALTVSDITISNIKDANNKLGELTMTVTVAATKAWVGGQPKEVTVTDVVFSGFKQLPTTSWSENADIPIPNEWKNLYSDAINRNNIVQYIQQHQDLFFKNVPTDFTPEDIVIVGYNPNRDAGLVRVNIGLKKYFNDKAIEVNDAGTNFTKEFNFVGFEKRNTRLKNDGNFVFSDLYVGDPFDLEDIKKINSESLKDLIIEKKSEIFIDAPDNITPATLSKWSYNAIYAEGKLVINFNLTNALPNAKDFVVTITGFKEKETRINAAEFALGDKSIPSAAETEFTIKQKILDNKSTIFTNLPTINNWKLINNLRVEDVNTNVVGEVTFTLKLSRVYTKDGTEKISQQVKFTGYRTQGITTTCESGKLIGASKIFASSINRTSLGELKVLIASSNIIKNTNNDIKVTPSAITLSGIKDANDLTGEITVTITVDSNTAWEEGRPQEKVFTDIRLSGFQTRNATQWAANDTITDNVTFRNEYANDCNNNKLQKYIFAYQDKFFSYAPETLQESDIEILEPVRDNENGVITFNLSLKVYYNSTDGILTRNEDQSFKKQFIINGFDTRNTQLASPTGEYQYSDLWNKAPVTLDDITIDEYRTVIAKKYTTIFKEYPDTVVKDNIQDIRITSKNPVTGVVKLGFELVNARPTQKHFDITITGFKEKITDFKSETFYFGDPAIANKQITDTWIKNELIKHKEDVFKNLPTFNFALEDNIRVVFNPETDTSTPGSVTCQVILSNVYRPEGVNGVGELSRTITIEGFKTIGLTTSITQDPLPVLDGFRDVFASDIDIVDSDTTKLINAIIKSDSITNIVSGKRLTTEDIELSNVTNTNDINGSITLTVTIKNKKAWINGQEQETRSFENVTFTGFNTRLATKWSPDTEINEPYLFKNIYANTYTAEMIHRYVTSYPNKFYLNTPILEPTDVVIFPETIKADNEAGRLEFVIGLKKYYDPNNGGLLTIDEKAQFKHTFVLTGFDTRNTKLRNNGIFRYSELNPSGVAPSLDEASIDNNYFKEKMILRNVNNIFIDAPDQISAENINIQTVDKNVATGIAEITFYLTNRKPDPNVAFKMTINGFTAKETTFKNTTFPFGKNDMPHNHVNDDWIRNEIKKNKDVMFNNLPNNYDFQKATIALDPLNPDTPSEIKFTLSLPDVFTVNKKPLVETITFYGFQTDGTTTEVNDGRLKGVEEIYASSIANNNLRLIGYILNTEGIITGVSNDRTLTQEDLEILRVVDVNDRMGTIEVDLKIKNNKAWISGSFVQSREYSNKKFSGFKRRSPTKWVGGDRTINDPSLADIYATQAEYDINQIQEYVFNHKERFFTDEPRSLIKEDIIITNPEWIKSQGAIHFVIKLKTYYDPSNALLEVKSETTTKFVSDVFKLSGFNVKETGVTGNKTFPYGDPNIPAGIFGEEDIRKILVQHQRDIFVNLPPNYEFTPENCVITINKTNTTADRLVFDLTLRNVYNVQDDSSTVVIKGIVFEGFKKDGLVTTKIKPTFTNPNPTSIDLTHEQLATTIGDKNKLFGVDWANNLNNLEHKDYILKYINTNISNLLDGYRENGQYVTATDVEIKSVETSTEDFRLLIHFSQWFTDSIPGEKVINGKLKLRSVPNGEIFEGGIEEEIKRRINAINAVESTAEKTNIIKEATANYLTTRSDEIPDTFLSGNDISTSQISCSLTFDKYGRMIIRDLIVHEVDATADNNMNNEIRIKLITINPNELFKNDNSGQVIGWIVISLVAMASFVLLVLIIILLNKKNRMKIVGSDFIGFIPDDYE